MKSAIRLHLPNGARPPHPLIQRVMANCKHQNQSTNTCYTFYLLSYPFPNPNDVLLTSRRCLKALQLACRRQSNPRRACPDGVPPGPAICGCIETDRVSQFCPDIARTDCKFLSVWILTSTNLERLACLRLNIQIKTHILLASRRQSIDQHVWQPQSRIIE